jgi:two-component system OmpR family response regulator
MLTILLFTNDSDLLATAQQSFVASQFHLVYCSSKREAISYICNSKIHLCLFDIENDGINLFSAIKLIDEKIPVAFMSNGKSAEDKYRAMDQGCDDFMLKKIAPAELLERVNAIMMRSKISTPSAEFPQYSMTIGNSTVDFNKRSFNTNSGVIHLSRKEAELLKIFCLNKGKLLSREQILREVWKNCDYYTSKSMDVYLTKLRKLLKHEATAEIRNVHGTGYIFVETTVAA